MPDSAPCTKAPTLLTSRLRLRAFAASDLDRRAALFADGAALAHVGGAQPREECWVRIQRYAGQWALDGFGLWAVEEQAGGALVGEVGLARFERGLGADFDDAPEGAWVIFPGAARGYATEAMTAAIGWHEVRFGPCRMVCVIAHENNASLRVAAKLGFSAFAERPYKGAPRLLLERSARRRKTVTPPPSFG